MHVSCVLSRTGNMTHIPILSMSYGDEENGAQCLYQHHFGVNLPFATAWSNK